MDGISSNIRSLDVVHSGIVIVSLINRLGVVVVSRNTHSLESGALSGKNWFDYGVHHDVLVISSLKVDINSLLMNLRLVVLGGEDFLGRSLYGLSSSGGFINRFILDWSHGLVLSWHLLYFDFLSVVYNFLEVNGLGDVLLGRGLEGLLEVLGDDFLRSYNWGVVLINGLSSLYIHYLLNGMSGRLYYSFLNGNSSWYFYLNALNLFLVVHNWVFGDSLGIDRSFYNFSSLYWGLNNSLSDNRLAHQGLGDDGLGDNLSGDHRLTLNFLSLGDVRLGVINVTGYDGVAGGGGGFSVGQDLSSFQGLGLDFSSEKVGLG